MRGGEEDEGGCCLNFPVVVGVGVGRGANQAEIAEAGPLRSRCGSYVGGTPRSPSGPGIQQWVGQEAGDGD